MATTARTAARSAVLAVTGVLLAGCGGGETEPARVLSQGAASPAGAAQPADPKKAYLSEISKLCTTLAGKVSGLQIQASADGKLTPAEVLSREEAGRPAVEAFDAGLAALRVPPEAADAHRALTDLLARNEPTVVKLLEAARAGDQAAVNAVLAEREKLRLGPQGIPSLVAAGIPEKCNYRASHS